MAGLEALAIFLAAVMFWHAWYDVMGNMVHNAISDEFIRGVCWSETMSLDDLIVRAGGRGGDSVRRHAVTGEMSGREGGERMGYGRHQTGGWGGDRIGERSRQHKLTREGKSSYQIYGRRDKRRDPSRSEMKVGTKRRLQGVWEAGGSRRTVGEGWIDLEAFSREQRVSLGAFDMDSNGRLEVWTMRQTDGNMHVHTRTRTQAWVLAVKQHRNTDTNPVHPRPICIYALTHTQAGEIVKLGAAFHKSLNPTVTMCLSREIGQGLQNTRHSLCTAILVLHGLAALQFSC